MISGKEGVTNCEGGIIRINTAKLMGKKCKMLEKADDHLGVFDQLIFNKRHGIVFGIVSESGSDSALYSIDSEGEITKYRAKTGPMLEHKKLSSDPFDTYLSVQLTSNSFLVISDLEKVGGLDVGPVVTVPESKVGKIAGVKLFDANKLCVVGTNGAIIYYEIQDKKKLKIIFEKKVQIHANEIVDCFDILVTGQIVAMTTREKTIAKASRMLVFQIEKKSRINKSWEFDFTLEEQKYMPVERYSNFFKIYINYLHNGANVIFGFQGS
jgi:hypothetical protein